MSDEPSQRPSLMGDEIIANMRQSMSLSSNQDSPPEEAHESRMFAGDEFIEEKKRESEMLDVVETINTFAQTLVANLIRAASRRPSPTMIVTAQNDGLALLPVDKAQNTCS